MSDLIKREDAIKAINLRARIPHDIASAQYASMAINAICSVPSADRPRGKWINKCGNKVCACSSCGEDYDHTYEWIERWNFCPNCGARMNGADYE